MQPGLRTVQAMNQRVQTCGRLTHPIGCNVTPFYTRGQHDGSLPTSSDTPPHPPLLSSSRGYPSKKIGDSLENLLTTGTGHRLPFFLILSVVVLLFGAAVQQYRKLMKSNFLGGMR